MNFRSFGQNGLTLVASRSAARSATIPKQCWNAKRFASEKAPSANRPTHDSRTSPRTADTPIHPGYTSADAPITSAHPTQMPDVSGVKRASTTPLASTRADAQHPGVHTMAEGAKHGGEDAVYPEERNVKNWSMNQRPAEFNPEEGKRNPVLHGGSHEGGHDSQGKSKT